VHKNATVGKISGLAHLVKNRAFATNV
jgi:hypothetical protein